MIQNINVGHSMTVVSIRMLSQLMHTITKSNLTFQRETEQHSESYRSKMRKIFLHSWLNTTRLHIGTEMGKVKSNSARWLTNAYQKQETNCRMYQIRHRLGDSQNAQRGIKMINKRIKGQSRNLKISIK